MVSAGRRHSLRHHHPHLVHNRDPLLSVGAGGGGGGCCNSDGVVVIIKRIEEDVDSYYDYVLSPRRLFIESSTSCAINASATSSDPTTTNQKSAMLCCGRKKDGHKEHPVEMAASPRRQGANSAATASETGGLLGGSATGNAPPMSSHYQTTVGGGGGMHPLSSVAAGTLGTDHRLAPHSSPGMRSMVVQSDFRKVSGISTEIFRQIETVENDHNDATTAAALEAVERRGEMLVRVLDPRQMGRTASEAARSFLTVQDPKYSVHFVEIVKRPGQTLGLYIREGNGIDRSDGVFISRIALESSVYNSGCLRVGDEILAINLVDVTRMSLDDVVIVMSIPRRLVLTTRQRRGPAGAVSPPPPRPEQKPPPVVVLKRGVQPEEPPDNDSTSNSNSNNGDRFQQYPYGGGGGGIGPSRFLTTGKPLPGMADLPIHGTFPRGNRERTEQQQRDLFREREAGRYPERAGDDSIHSSIRQQHQQQQDAVDHYYSNYRMQEQQQQQQQQRYQPGRQGGTLERPKHPNMGGGGGGSGGGEGMTHQIDSYHPPPPLPVTEQPKPGMTNSSSSSSTTHHFHQHPFDRSAGFGPKTLESLAERVHPFYGLSIGPPGSGSGSSLGQQQHQTATLGRSSTLGRAHKGGSVAGGSGPGSTMSLMRGTAGNRLTRSGSDQRLPIVEQSSSTDMYGYARGKLGSGSHYGTTGRPQQQQQQQQPDAATRLGLTHRRRTSVDYASDTEASIRSYSHSTRRGFSVEGSSGSWKAPPPLLGLGITPTTPTSVSFHPTSQPDSRSNSLPRDRGGGGSASNRFRREVHFEQTSLTGRPSASSMLDNTDDSDGAVSAPEMTVSQKQKQLQRLSQQQQHLQQQQLLYSRGILPGSAAPLSKLPGGMPGNFTAAEYKAWMQRAPSTSAIYERLRQSRDAIEAHRVAKLTFSAENLVEKAKQEIPYYAYRSHFTATPNTGLLDENEPSSHLSLGGQGVGLGGSKSLLVGRSGSSGAVTELQPETPRGGIPQPTPANPNAARPTDPRFKLLEINPADFIKYRSERPNGATPTTHQMANTSGTSGMTTPTPAAGGGPGPAPGGGIEEGVSGLLWIHLLAGRGLRSTSSRLEPVRDLYCVLECDRAHKARTVIRSGDINFDWDETFDLDLVVNRELDFLIYSWDPQLRHRLCFKGSLHLVPLVRESTIHQVALKVEPRGTLYLKLRYTEPRTAFRRSPAGRKTPPPLFGVDLETVVTREGGNNVSSASLLTGGNGGVPIIVQKCVEEVERRGMDIVGLYRLCGSATKKRILREAFERNPRLVDLSPDSVPDINVITGLLKEYLRELPEPLLTKCLYQMLVDALAVCLPDDPEGNAKLMFSILECLPKGNRTTLFLLMDHLCLVTAQSDRNKMTPQNLAICFGPVLMLHSDDGSTLSSSSTTSTGLDFQKPIGVLKYLLQIWPMKSARAVEAAATASSTLRRIQQQQLQLQQRTASVAAQQQPSQQPQLQVQVVTPSAAPQTPSTSSTVSTNSSIIINNTMAAGAGAVVSAGPLTGPSTGHRVADRRLDLPPLPPRPAPKVLQPRALGGGVIGGNNNNNSSSSSVMKSPRSSGGPPSSDAPIIRGEADGSPAPLSTDSAAGAGSETPSLTSPTSTTSTTTSLNSPVQQHQQQSRAAAGESRGRGRLPQRKDYDSEDDCELDMSNHPGAMRMMSHKDDPSAGAGLVTADDTDQGESDLESPN